MLPKEKRLNLKKNFNFVVSGRKTETPSLRLYFRKGENQDPLVGIALAKKNFRKATERNKAKRLTSRAIESLYQNLRKGLNLVIMPKREVLQRDQEVLKEELESVKDLYTVD